VPVVETHPIDTLSAAWYHALQIMFLRANKRFKDGKEHRYWSVVENRRVSPGKTVQKTLLYLGEINDSERANWTRAIEAHIFISFLSYCLYITLEKYNQAKATGLSARSVLARFAEIQMLDVTIPTTDGREIRMKRHTKPEKLHQLLLNQLGLNLPAQPPPEIKAQDMPVV
jgi:hypothetical protein